ncbi:hypothetical protein OC25_10385 [Pedobacter kyungheensis]|uniref:Lipoprotein n=1 Tax=Pedobacter kyungheensis TaxID=1069985 RepID=A0A0C1FMV6_9SPHI|nr:hypothetical protein [Pedobacter kyungheensis]KIA94317.1 hypothetical protein OC25_10385 [Pedobacter kyungheensis]
MEKRLNIIRPLVLFTMTILLICSCKKEEQISSNIKSNEVLKKEWLTVSDPRWVIFMLDKARKDNPNSSLKDLITPFLNNTIILGKAQNTIKKQWLQLGGTVAELDSISSRHLQSVYNMSKKDANYKLPTLDTGKWKNYLAEARPNVKKEKLMTVGGSFEDVNFTACEIPDDLQAFADSPEAARYILIMYTGSTEASDICKYRVLKELIRLYDEFYTSGTPESCAMLRMHILSVLSEYYACDKPGGNDAGGGGPGGGGVGSGESASVNMKDGDKFVNNDNIDKEKAKKISSIEELNVYLEQIRNEISKNAIIEKTGRIRYNVDGISGIDVSIKLNNAESSQYKVENVTSDIWGFAPFMDWKQSDFSQNANGDITRVEVLGYLSLNLILKDIGRLYSMRITFIIDINHRSGEFVATKVKSFN